MSLIQHAPVESLSSQLGELVVDIRVQVERLVSSLKRLDEVKETLRNQEHMDVTIDLGEVGNAAAMARRQLVNGDIKTTFELPR